MKYSAIRFSPEMLLIAVLALSGCGEKTGNVASSESPSTTTTNVAGTGITQAPSSVAPTTVAYEQAADEVFLESLDAADYPILKDILSSTYERTPYCPETDRCGEFVVSRWAKEMAAEPTRPRLDLQARKIYLSSLEGKAPHVQQQITSDAFAARYSQLKQLVASKNLCFLYAPWKLEFIDNQYHFSGGNGRHTAVITNLFNTMNQQGYVFEGENTFLSMAGKNFAPVPAQVMGEEGYKKFAAYSAVTDVEARPVLKICGTLKGQYSLPQVAVIKPPAGGPPLAPPPIPEISMLANRFELSKPIEIVQPPAMKKIDSIPVEWFK